MLFYKKGEIIIFTRKSKVRKIKFFSAKVIKSVTLFSVGIFAIGAVIFSKYKPAYKVTFKGQVLGYISDKKQVEENINQYLDYGEGENASFVYIEEKPSYNLCLVEKDTDTIEDEVLEKVKEEGTLYYETYVIKSNGEDKLYVATEQQAQDVIKQVQDKKGEDTNLQYEVRYETQLNNTTTEDAVEKLYVKKTVVTRNTSSSTVSRSSSSTKTTASTTKISGVFIKPVDGVYTNNFRSGHPAIDIAGPVGTPIKAAASGTVIESKWAGGNSYGNLVKIQHDNGYVTYYAHLSERLVSKGDKVVQGQTIGLRGSTGNSTGPHLHFEIRVKDKGTGVNPRNYF